MNYLEYYLNFITGKNRKKLYKNIHDLADDIRTDNLDHMKTLLDEECIADISMISKGISGHDNIVNALSFPVKDVNLRKIMISNVASRLHNGKAQQYAQVQCIFGYEDDENVYPFVFGGQFAISYKQVSDDWKMTHIKFDLIYEAGNNAIVAGKWKLIDYAIFSGHEPMINALYDSPWRVIPLDDEPMSDVEQIYDAMNRANSSTDGGDWLDYASCLSDEFSMDMSARANSNKAYLSTTDKLMSNVPSNVSWIRGKFHKEPRLQHVCTLIDIVFNEDHTEAKVYDFRSEFNRLYNDIYDKDNIHSIAYTAIHINTMVKEDGRWKLKSGSFIPHQEFRYVDDDCIEYDDYICGGVTWDQVVL